VSSTVFSATADQGTIREVIIIGAGIAGLSAACALADSGYRVRLLERRPYVGGRASSYEHPGTGETIDNCQHVLLGCCTNLTHFYRTIGATGSIRWLDNITFVEPGGRRSTIRSSALPAPFQSALSFLSAPMLSLEDKIGIARALAALARALPPDSNENFQSWLSRHRQTARAIERFWRPVIVSALNDEPDRVSVHYAAQVFQESFLKSRSAGNLGIPAVPLGEIYAHATEYITARHGEIMLRSAVEAFKFDPQTSRWSVATAVKTYQADAIVFAVPFDAMRKLLPLVPGGNPAAVEALQKSLDRFQSSPITGIHLWLDRVITDLDQAALLESPIQWIFQKAKLPPANGSSNPGSYIQLVSSASADMLPMSRQQIIDLAMQELPQFFPAATGAQILKSAVVKEVQATFSVTPGLNASRAAHVSPWPRAFLAGDWTATGWPSTMEGATRSGYLAAQAVATAAGRPTRFLQPDLPATGLVRLLLPSRNRPRRS
jgi:zeta-carotene desaturase